MSSTGGTQRSSGSGFFVGKGPAAKAGNDALEKGFGLAKAAAEARKTTGSGPGPYFAGSKQEYRPQNFDPAIASARVAASNRTRWSNLKDTTGTTKGGGRGFKDKGGLKPLRSPADKERV